MEHVNTQLAESAQAASLYDDCFDLIAVIEVSERAVNGARQTLNRVHTALQGLTAVNQILLANSIMGDCDGMQPMSPYLVGGLMSAQRALTDMSFQAIETFAGCEQARRDADHD